MKQAEDEDSIRSRRVERKSKLVARPCRFFYVCIESEEKYNITRKNPILIRHLRFGHTQHP
jgi:hypothetical protein